MKKLLVLIFVVLATENCHSTSFSENGASNYGTKLHSTGSSYSQSATTNYKPQVSNYNQQASGSSYNLQPQTLDTGYNSQPQGADSYGQPQVSESYSQPQSSATSYSQQTDTSYQPQYQTIDDYSFQPQISGSSYNQPQSSSYIPEPHGSIDSSTECQSSEPNQYTTSCTTNGKSMYICLNGHVLATVQCPSETPYCDQESLTCIKSTKKFQEQKKPQQDYNKPSLVQKRPIQGTYQLKPVVRRPIMRPVIRRPAPTYQNRIDSRIYYTRYPTRRQPIRRRTGTTTQPKIRCSNSNFKTKCTPLGLKTFNEVAALNVATDRFKLSCMELNGNSERKLVTFDCPADEFNCDNVTAVSSYVNACGFNECVRSASWIKFSCVLKTKRRIELRRRSKRDVVHENVPKENTKTYPAIDFVLKSGNYLRSGNPFSSSKIKLEAMTDLSSNIETSGVIPGTPTRNSGSSVSSNFVSDSISDTSSLGSTTSGSSNCSSTSDSLTEPMSSSNSASTSGNLVSSSSKCLNSELARRCSFLSYSTPEQNTNQHSDFLLRCLDPTVSNEVLLNCTASLINCQNTDEVMKLAPGCKLLECNSMSMKIFCNNDQSNVLQKEKAQFDKISTPEFVEQTPESSDANSLICSKSEFRKQCTLLAHSSVEENHLSVSGFLVQCYEPYSSATMLLFDCPRSLVSCDDIISASSFVPGCSFVECNTAGYIKFNCGTKISGKFGPVTQDIKNFTVFYSEDNEVPIATPDNIDKEIMEAIESIQDSTYSMNPELVSHPTDLDRTSRPGNNPLVNRLTAPIREAVSIVATNRPNNVLANVITSLRPNNGAETNMAGSNSNSKKNLPLDSPPDSVVAPGTYYPLPLFPWDYVPVFPIM